MTTMMMIIDMIDMIWEKEDELNSADHVSRDEENSSAAAVLSTTSPLHPPPAQPLPDSNGTLKSLDIGRSSRCLHSWLFGIPNLLLKELSTSRPHS